MNFNVFFSLIDDGGVCCKVLNIDMSAKEATKP